MKKLYELTKGEKIYGKELVGTNEPIVLVFDHIDGAYSVCYVDTPDGKPVKNEKGERLYVPLAAWTSLEEYEGGYMAVEEDEEPKTEKLFVYGIFLGESNRQTYGMTNPQYATVPGYITVGGQIVQAQPVQSQDVALTGLLVDMGSTRWQGLDALEGGYDRVKVKTTTGVEAFMYVTPQSKLKNYSIYKHVTRPYA